MWKIIGYLIKLVMSTKFGIRIFHILKFFFQVKHWVFMETVSCYFFFFKQTMAKGLEPY